ncbi:guided entry of tail-anchored proteins factor 1 isoform X1 [Daphnia magna]|uniref:guided entry of tail-anchored proteins factor 1 isoform X1 n=1 Tax=Daphnia magna TaxID=35525 RepID=UPI001E1BB9EA|nr:guided entry of tail-anchored proteins factor 1 isoform X1 [Daphnia magna]XP_045032910.1 guided entry of tail-anchored proteins factor 1 isoform X1 [Daphnia magna]
MFTFWMVALFMLIGSLLPNIVKWSTDFIFKVTDEEKRIREEFKELRKELAGISAVDEFARYARTQRKMNKLDEQIQALGQSRMDDRESIKWKFTKTIQIINGAVLVYLAVTQRYEPVLTGLSDWFWPLNIVLSYPTGIEGALSIVFWLFICNNACRVLIK